MVSTSAAEARATGAAPRRWPGQEGRSCQSVPRGKHVRGSRPSRRSSLSRPRVPSSERRHGHQVSTGSTGDRFGIETTTPGLDELDQRSVQYRDHDTTSRQARPMIGRDHHVGRACRDLACRPLNVGMVTRSRQARPMIGRDHPVGRACRDLACRPLNVGMVTRSRQARPAIGRDHPVGRACRDLASRPLNVSTVTRSRQARPAIGRDHPVGRACRDLACRLVNVGMVTRSRRARPAI
jgi:hypothetical protein